MSRNVVTILMSLLCISVMAADKPNIILIMADDVGMEAFGSYGSASYKTPNLDRMAAEGMRFTHAYSQPLCTPSRVQIMTGQYNFRNYTNFGVLGPNEVTFGHLLQKAGYATCVAGKWQLYGSNNGGYEMEGKGMHPRDAGFDDYCLWQVDKVKKFGERYADPLIDQKGQELTSHKGKYGPDIFTDFILDFIEDKKDEPFFVYYPMALVHNPFVPTPDSDGWDGDRYAKDTDYFAHMVSYMDKVTGQIKDKVIELGLGENTLILFTGDNGTNKAITSLMKDGRRITGDKGQPTDAGTHVPFIAWQPGTVKSGTINDNLTDFTDVLPTVVELAGAELPTDRVMDGMSLASQLKGEEGPVRDWVYCYYDPKWGQREKARFARDRRWKLYDDGRLIDVSNDPLEKNPTSGDHLTSEMAAAQAKLQLVLDRLK